jgi:hypothetical protein
VKTLLSRSVLLLALTTAALACALTRGSTGGAPGDEAQAPPVEPAVVATTANPGETPGQSAGPIKLIFIHHSSGENWLSDENGGLGIALRDHGYFVSDTNYDWGPEAPELGGPIGSYTDLGNWWNWFLAPQRDTVMAAVYAESEQHASYSRHEGDPGGENAVIVFKSCFPNSALAGDPTSPPTTGDNPLHGQSAGSEAHTVANAKGLYLELLTYFATRPDKMFIAVTAPPLQADETDPQTAANARAFNRWLVEDWLAGYALKNVAVFDFYNVLTSNGGDPDRNDAGSPSGNHHRLRGGQIEYVTDQGEDVSAYAYPGDSHPTAAGNQKATREFVPLLDYYVAAWRATGP